MNRHHDPRSLSDRELIGSILHRDTKKQEDRQIIREVLSTITEKGKAIRYDDFKDIPGIGEKTRLKLLSCFELSRRYCPQEPITNKVTRPEDILPLIDAIRGKKQECFVCITLNGAGEVLGNRVITIGLLNHSLVHPREVFCDAITDRAASIICAHNHPSGSLEPSSQDIAITSQLKEAGSLVGIQLVDHVIVTRTGFLSMRERGLI